MGSHPRNFWQRHRRWLVGDFTLKRMLWSMLFLYAVITAFAYLFGDWFLFRPPEPGYPADADWLVRIPVTEDESIAACWAPAENERAVVLYCHGNATDLSGVRPLARLWNQRGLSMLAFDYRGYGHSDGRVNAPNCNADVEAAYRYLTEELDVAPERIVVHGRSLGGGPALNLATRRPVGGVILECTFTSPYRVLTRWPILPLDRFPNASRIRKLDGPVLVMHGRQDRIVPFHHGLTLFRLANEPKQSLWVDDAGHDDLLLRAEDRYWAALDELADRAVSDRALPSEE